ncbi:MAG TPA: NAD(P)/FAD-dependent oxidoreductase [Pseudolabrys sp.]|nr:NAD(P)/FAD-dependent oxidoreductase [Pseudolabrys sp.]
MAESYSEVVVIGGGAAGIAAARHLSDAGMSCLLIEARARLGGRAFTAERQGFPLDLGCGWLHSADRNPWAAIAQAQGLTLDKSAPPWERRSLSLGFPKIDQESFTKARHEFYARREAAIHGPDRVASDLLEPGNRWNEMLNAVSTYISGAELDQLSLIDLENYDDTGVNWRVVEGYGTAIAAHAAPLRTLMSAPVQRIDHSGKRLRIETAKGVVTADRAIIALPSAILSESETLFAPALPQKVEAAAGLPLGLADKLFLALEHAEEFDKDSRLFGHTDRAATATYHLRPSGRPLIEVYFGGRNADALEAHGEHAFFEAARDELVGLLGADFARRIKPLSMHPWRADPFARGSYSYALPGKADCRATLAQPVDGRLFFAGEACSKHDYSTAHGAYRSGIAAAEAVLAATGKYPPSLAAGLPGP